MATEKEKAVRAKREAQPPATKAQIAKLHDWIGSGKLGIRDKEYIEANIDRMTKRDAAGILKTLKEEQA